MLKSILVALFLFFTSVTSAQTMKLYNRLELVMDKAEQGDPQAQFNVGVIYNLGWNTPVDNQKALYWFKKAAEQGHTSSIYNIGVFYLNGFGVDVNYVEAAKWLEQAVNKGHFNALINLHWIYAEGHLPRDDEKLFQLEEKAFVNATAEERFVLANSYFSDMYQPRERGVYWLYKAVELGHIKAKLQLASLYVNGEFVEKDFKKAFSLSQDVAETGDPDGQYLLGGLFQLGLGTEKNQVIAVKWFRKAAEQGLADAEYSLGLCYLKGWGVEKDLTQSFDWFLKSAEKGVVKGQVDVARAYLLGIGVQKDHNKAKYWLEKAALAGDVNAQFMLGGLLYEKSKKKGQAQHRDRGLELTILAAEQGLRDAQYNLGIYYKTLKQNTKAIYWFEKAAIQGDVFAFAKLAEMYPKKEQAKRLAAVAEQGDPQSAYSLSMMYRSKRFGKKNDKEMQKWLLNAAARGHQAAQVELGLRYLGGNIFPKDIEKGIFWLEKSAEEDIQIQLELAERYFKGNDVPKNIERSYYWLENAAKQGSAEAQFILAHFYLNGVGGQTDNQKAKMWFEYALENGIDEANVYLAELDTEGRYANFDYTPYAEKGNVDAQFRLAILKHKQEQYKEAVKWLEKLEKRGEPYAKFLLGLYYFNGIELKQDTQKALALLKEAAEADLAEAQLVLFELYDYGVKEVGSQQQAKAWLDKAVQQGFIPAMHSMALLYKKQNELKSALEMLEKAAQLNDLEAQRELISFYLQPEVQDYKKAFDWAEKVAEQGDEFALITLATYYAKGIGVQADLAKAETILAPLVQKEDLFAKYALGLIRMEQQKIEEAIALIEPLAKIEFADAQFQLGRIYLDKRFSVQNDSLAYRWLLKAAEHHHPEAQYMLFAMYSDGVAVPQDNEKANYWLDRAIAQGEPKALFFKAQQQLKEQNTEQAVKLLQNAANQGIDMAKVTLGILYMQGRGVEKNLSQAEFWFNQISNERKGQIIDQLFFPYEHKKIQADWKDQ